jgi:hypothetical protein
MTKFDPSWMNFRNTKKWNGLIKQFPMKEYSNLAIAAN